MASVALSDPVVYFKGFQPAVDEAVDSQVTQRRCSLTSPPSQPRTCQRRRPRAVSRATRPSPQRGTAKEEHDDEGVDPHFWFDLSEYADVAEAIGARLARLTPITPTTTATQPPAYTAAWTPSTRVVAGPGDAGVGSW